MSEWLFFNTKWANLQLSLLEQPTFWYKTNMLSWTFIVIAQWNNSLQVDMLKVVLNTFYPSMVYWDQQILHSLILDIQWNIRMNYW
jgi:hypothetical protein